MQFLEKMLHDLKDGMYLKMHISQWANQESNKVERYSKTYCAGWTGMPQGFQIYVVWNPIK